MSGETILVVDDEAHIVELARLYLEICAASFPELRSTE